MEVFMCNKLDNEFEDRFYDEFDDEFRFMFNEFETLREFGDGTFMYKDNHPDGFELIELQDDFNENDEEIDLIIPEKIRSYNVVSIGCQSLLGHNFIKSVVIPASVKKIDHSAFAYCNGLKKVTFLSENIDVKSTAFHECDSLCEINSFMYKMLSPVQFCNVIEHKFDIWDTLDKVEKDDFLSCFKKSEEFCKAVYSSNNYDLVAFALDLNLKLIISDFDYYIKYHREHNNTAISAKFLDKKITNFTQQEIDEFNENLELVNLGLRVPDIDQLNSKWKIEIGNFDGYTISGYKGVETTEILTAETIKEYNIVSFVQDKEYSFAPLEKLVIGDGILSIEYGAFSDCKSLEKIVMPNTVESLGMKCFANCTNLKEIVMPNTLDYIDAYAFSNCSALKEITLPENLTKIPIFLFDCCESLEKIVIPNSVKLIDEHAFFYCRSLIEIVIPSSVEKICEYCFENCINLERVAISSSDTKIDSSAFYNCDKVEIVKLWLL